MVDRGRSRGWGGRSAPSDDNARCLRNVNASQCICALAASDGSHEVREHVTRGVTCFDSKEAALATGRIMQPRRGAAESWWWSALSSEMISMPHERVPLFEPAYVERIEAVRATTPSRVGRCVSVTPCQTPIRPRECGIVALLILLRTACLDFRVHIAEERYRTGSTDSSI